MKNWKRVFGQKLRHMTKDDCVKFIADRGPQSSLNINIGGDDIRSVTGGFSSQAINFYVLRAIALKAKD
jgi:hypothetical protein